MNDFVVCSVLHPCETGDRSQTAKADEPCALWRRWSNGRSAELVGVTSH